MNRFAFTLRSNLVCLVDNEGVTHVLSLRDARRLILELNDCLLEIAERQEKEREREVSVACG